jgi:hypothetical protein
MTTVADVVARLRIETGDAEASVQRLAGTVAELTQKTTETGKAFQDASQHAQTLGGHAETLGRHAQTIAGHAQSIGEASRSLATPFPPTAASPPPATRETPPSPSLMTSPVPMAVVPTAMATRPSSEAVPTSPASGGLSSMGVATPGQGADAMRISMQQSMAAMGLAGGAGLLGAGHPGGSYLQPTEQPGAPLLGQPFGQSDVSQRLTTASAQIAERFTELSDKVTDLGTAFSSALSEVNDACAKFTSPATQVAGAIGPAQAVQAQLPEEDIRQLAQMASQASAAQAQTSTTTAFAQAPTTQTITLAPGSTDTAQMGGTASELADALEHAAQSAVLLQTTLASVNQNAARLGSDTASVGGDLRNASSGAQGLSDGIHGASSNAAELGVKLGAGGGVLDELKGKATGFGSTLAGAAGVASLTAGMAGLVVMTKDYTETMQGLGVQLNAVLGASGPSALGQMTSLSNELGQSLQATGSAYVTFAQATRGSNENMTQDMKVFSDAAAGTGDSITQVAQLVGNYYQLIQRIGGTGGVGSRAATALITQHIIDPDTANQLRIAANLGANTQDLLNTILADIERQYSGAGAAQRKTVTGQLTVFRSDLETAIGTAGEDLMKSFASSLEKVGASLSSAGFEKAARDAAEFAEAIAKGTVEALKLLEPIAKIVVSVGEAVDQMKPFRDILEVVAGLLTAMIAIKWAGTLISDLGNLVVGTLRYVGILGTQSAETATLTAQVAALNAEVATLTANYLRLAEAQGVVAATAPVAAGSELAGGGAVAAAGGAGLLTRLGITPTGRGALATGAESLPFGMSPLIPIAGGAVLSYEAANINQSVPGAGGEALGALARTGGYAAIGAGIGSMIPIPGGTVIGAGVGAVVGVAQSIFDALNASSVKAAQHLDQLAQAATTSAQNWYKAASQPTTGETQVAAMQGAFGSAVSSLQQIVARTLPGQPTGAGVAVLEHSAVAESSKQLIKQYGDSTAKVMEQFKQAAGPEYNVNQNVALMQALMGPGTTQQQAAADLQTANINAANSMDANASAIRNWTAGMNGAAETTESFASQLNTVGEQIAGSWGQVNYSLSGSVGQLAGPGGMGTLMSVAQQQQINPALYGVSPTGQTQTFQQSAASVGTSAAAVIALVNSIQPGAMAGVNPDQSLTPNVIQAAQAWITSQETEIQSAQQVHDALFSLTQSAQQLVLAQAQARDAVGAYGQVLANTQTITVAGQQQQVSYLSSFTNLNSVLVQLAQAGLNTGQNFSAMAAQVTNVVNAANNAQKAFEAVDIPFQALSQTLTITNQQLQAQQALASTPLVGTQAQQAQENALKAQAASYQAQIDALKLQLVPSSAPSMMALQTALNQTNTTLDLITQQAAMGPGATIQGGLGNIGGEIGAATAQGLAQIAAQTPAQQIAIANQYLAAMNAQAAGQAAGTGATGGLTYEQALSQLVQQVSPAGEMSVSGMMSASKAVGLLATSISGAGGLQDAVNALTPADTKLQTAMQNALSVATPLYQQIQNVASGFQQVYQATESAWDQQKQYALTLDQVKSNALSAQSSIAQLASTFIQDTANSVTEGDNTIKGLVSTLTLGINAANQVEQLQQAVNQSPATAQSMSNAAYKALETAITNISSGTSGALSASNLAATISAYTKSYAAGGPVDETGLATLHQGEYVLNASQAAIAAQAQSLAAQAPWRWTGAEWSALNALEMMEAGWNPSAQNPHSQAYGIAQFINGPTEYYEYGGNPGTVIGQLTGMFNYVKARYGDPISAYAHELATSPHWYQQGGIIAGSVGSAVPIMAHAGEMVLNLEAVQALNRGVPITLNAPTTMATGGAGGLVISPGAVQVEINSTTTDSAEEIAAETGSVVTEALTTIINTWRGR